MNDDKHDQFAEYMRRALRYALGQVQTTPGLLADELRELTWNVLELGLPVAQVWPEARPLLLGIAPKMEQAGFRDDWFPYLEAGVNQSQQHEDALTSGELHLHLGELHRLRSNFAESARQLDEALRDFSRAHDRHGQARTLNQLAYLHYQTHDYEKATSRAQEASALLPPNDLEQAMSLSALGLVAIDENRWQEAEQLHREALAIRTHYHDQRRMAWSLQNLGYALRGQGRYDNAIECYEQAIKNLLEIEDPARAAVARMNMGIAYSLAGDSARALAAYRAAEAVFRSFHDLHNLAKLHNNRGLEYLQLRQWQDAEDDFVACVTLHEQMGDVPLRLNALDGLAMACHHQQHDDEAERHLLTALAELPPAMDGSMHNYLAETLPKHLMLVQAAKRERLSGHPAP